MKFRQTEQKFTKHLSSSVCSVAQIKQKYANLYVQFMPKMCSSYQIKLYICIKFNKNEFSKSNHEKITSIKQKDCA